MKALSIIRSAAVGAALVICAGCASGAKEAHQSKVSPGGEGYSPDALAMRYDMGRGEWGYRASDIATPRYNPTTQQWEPAAVPPPQGYVPIAPKPDRDLKDMDKHPLDDTLRSAP